MILSWRIHQVASTKQFWKAFLGYGDWWDLYILRKLCCGQWGAVGVLNGAKLGLGLCQVIPHVHFEHGGPWINDLGDFVPLLICIFFFFSFLFFCRFVWDIRTLIVEHYLNMDSR